MSDDSNPRMCFAPGCSNKGTKKCPKCGLARYCGKECQKKSWKEHKKECATMSISPGGSAWRELNPAGVYEDPATGRSFTFGGTAFEGGGAGSMQAAAEMVRAMAGLSGDGDGDDETEEGATRILRPARNGRLERHKPPLRFDKGDEVDVACDVRSSVPPFREGWFRGVVLKTHAYEKAPTNPVYLVKLHDGGDVVPGHRDDPDYVRGVGVRDDSDDTQTTRFKPGDEVECQVGPDTWHRGIVRETRVPYPGWGRGWTEDGAHDRRHRGPKDVVAYLVTPKGKTYRRDDPRSTIMVPADKDCFIREWHVDRDDPMSTITVP